MIGTIIWFVTMFGCAALFFGIGVYAKRLEKPMWFWSGVEVEAAVISDIPAYNRENSRMWKLYSLWYWAAGLIWIWSEGIALTILVLSCTVGIIFLVRNYRKIEKKYKKTGL